jgi:hypothetical protein
MRANLSIYQGTVVSVSERVSGATTTGTISSIHTMPEIWIATADGRELRFCARFLTECRVGHEVIIAADKATGEPLGMRNLTTDGSWHARHLSDPDPVGFGASACLAVAACCITWFITMLVFGEPRHRDTLWEQTGPLLFYAAAILAAFALPTRWHRAEVRRLTHIRDDLARALWNEEHQKQGKGTQT